MFLNLIKNKIFLITLLVVFSISSFIFIYFNNSEESVEVETLALNNDVKKIDVIDEEIFTVEIKGAVVNPGVYKLKSGSRIIDVVNLAGGFVDGASSRYVNLSKKISDEMSIIIYTNDEINSLNQKNVVVVEEHCVCPEIKNDACLEDIKNNNLISINTATIEELMKIPGIGESKAKSIIEYRTSTVFEKIEDIMNVKGIGESLFNAIKEYITV